MKIFAYDSETDSSIDDEELTLDEVLDEFYHLSENYGSFFGIVRENLPIVQFFYDHDTLLIDIPIDPTSHSVQKPIEYNDAVDVIKEIDAGTYNPKDLDSWERVLLNP